MLPLASSPTTNALGASMAKAWAKTSGVGRVDGQTVGTQGADSQGNVKTRCAVVLRSAARAADDENVRRIEPGHSGAGGRVEGVRRRARGGATQGGTISTPDTAVPASAHRNVAPFDDEPQPIHVGSSRAEARRGEAHRDPGQRSTRRHDEDGARGAPGRSRPAHDVGRARVGRDDGRSARDARTMPRRLLREATPASSVTEAVRSYHAALVALIASAWSCATTSDSGANGRVGGSASGAHEMRS